MTSRGSQEHATAENKGVPEGVPVFRTSAGRFSGSTIAEGETIVSPFCFSRNGFFRHTNDAE